MNPKKVFVKDNFTLGKNSKIDDFGFLHIDNVTIARTGIQEYLENEIFRDGDPHKTVKVARLPKDVLDFNSIQTFKNIPLSDNHPTELITSKNFSKYQKGSIAKVDPKDNKYLITDITVNDEELVKKIKNGKVELSVGYTTILIQEDGEIDGEKYSYRQTEIIANHLAVVSRGRCGSKCSLVGDDGSLIKLNNKRRIMKKIQIMVGDTKKEVEVADEVVSHIDSLEAKVDVLDKKLLDSEKKREQAVTDAISLVNEKTRILKLAKDRGIKIDKTLSLFDTKSEILKKLDYKIDGKSEDYITALIDNEIERGDKINKQQQQIDSSKINKNNDGGSLWDSLIIGGE